MQSSIRSAGILFKYCISPHPFRKPHHGMTCMDLQEIDGETSRPFGIFFAVFNVA